MIAFDPFAQATKPFPLACGIGRKKHDDMCTGLRNILDMRLGQRTDQGGKLQVAFKQLNLVQGK